MAKQKLKPYKPCDLKPSANLYPDSQPCVRKTFSASFVSQPAENHTFILKIDRCRISPRESSSYWGEGGGGGGRGRKGTKQGKGA